MRERRRGMLRPSDWEREVTEASSALVKALHESGIDLPAGGITVGDYNNGSGRMTFREE